ncbi:hypothetical protein P167DRAFT_368779 [Morchella conica CCBAS932]|uniref:Uncharacterized protein n=2 Tax=Morchella sect. Distantes TaxID=1051054 RepID=A0A3N4KQG2_9PEZI|nr:hypothetical protein P167DRAFT_368779 [Morchella conica CCBAS932]
MCVKLLITPLIDAREFEKATDTTQFVETPTSLTGRMISEKSQHVYYENQLRRSSNMRPHQQQDMSRLAPFIMSGKRLSNDGKVVSLFSRFTGKIPMIGRLNIAIEDSEGRSEWTIHLAGPPNIAGISLKGCTTSREMASVEFQLHTCMFSGSGVFGNSVIHS